MSYRHLTITIVAIIVIVTTLVSTLCLTLKFIPLRLDTRPFSHQIYGQTTLKSGNCMPTINSSRSNCQIAPTKTKIFVYTYQPDLSPQQIPELSDPLYQTTTDNLGHYSLTLPVGLYTLVIKSAADASITSSMTFEMLAKDQKLDFGLSIATF